MPIYHGHKELTFASRPRRCVKGICCAHKGERLDVCYDCCVHTLGCVDDFEAVSSDGSAYEGFQYSRTGSSAYVEPVGGSWLETRDLSAASVGRVRWLYL